jgi:tagatose 6-phosphate kinase
MNDAFGVPADARLLVRVSSSRRNDAGATLPSMILCIGTTPALQRVMVFRRLELDAVNRAARTLDGVAGKSINVAKVLSAMGEQPVAVGFLGGDSGKTVRAWLVARGIESDFVTVKPLTRQCTTVIDEATGEITELVEESRAVTAEDYEQLMAVIRSRLARTSHVGGYAPSDCRAAIMSGTLTPGGPVGFYFHCTRLAREAGGLAIVDAQGPALVEALKAAPSLIKPNRAELAATVGRELNSEGEVVGAMREMRERGAERVVVTAGKEAALAFDGRKFWRVVSPRIKAVNPIGSGDAFTAGLASRLVKGADLPEACRWGAAMGAANALTLMAGEVDAEEVERLAKEVRVEEIGSEPS